MNADKLAAETKTDRIVRLALAAGRHATERDQLRDEANALRACVEAVVNLYTFAMADDAIRELCERHGPELARLRGLCEKAGIDTEERR